MRAIIAIVLCAAALGGLHTRQQRRRHRLDRLCGQAVYSPYNPKDMKQCVAACIACDHGVDHDLLDGLHAEGRALRA